MFNYQNFIFMLTVFIFIVLAFAVAITFLIITYLYMRLAVWRCKLVYNKKAGIWLLPFWAIGAGYIKYRNLKQRNILLLQKSYEKTNQYIFHQYQVEDYIDFDMARFLAFSWFSKRFFTKLAQEQP